MGAHIWRVPDHRIKSAIFHDVAEAFVPIEGADADEVVGVEGEIGGDEGIAAFDIVLERREEGGVGAEQLAVLGEGGAGLAFEHFEVKGELGDFDGAGVEVHAVDGGGQDAAFEIGGEVEVAGGGIGPAVGLAAEFFVLDQGGLPMLAEAFERADEERTRAAGGIEDAELQAVRGCFAL